MDIWIRLLAILLGLISCFYGYPLFRVFLVLAGLFYGYVYGQTFLVHYHPLIGLMLGVVLAVLLALLAYPLWSFGVGLIGAFFGFMLLAELAVVLLLPHFVVWLAGGVGAAIVGYAFYQARDFFVMVTTAVNGAVQTLYGVGLIHGAISFGYGRSNVLALVAIIILAAAGLTVQYKMFSDRRLYGEPAGGRNSHR